MWIMTKTIVTFHPTEEYEEIQRFMENNDMSKWKEYPSTVSITFVNEQTYFIGGNNYGNQRNHEQRRNRRDC